MKYLWTEVPTGRCTVTNSDLVDQVLKEARVSRWGWVKKAAVIALIFSNNRKGSLDRDFKILVSTNVSLNAPKLELLFRRKNNPSRRITNTFNQIFATSLFLNQIDDIQFNAKRALNAHCFTSKHISYYILLPFEWMQFLEKLLRGFAEKVSFHERTLAEY